MTDIFSSDHLQTLNSGRFVYYCLQLINGLISIRVMNTLHI